MTTVQYSEIFLLKMFSDISRRLIVLHSGKAPGLLDKKAHSITDHLPD